MKKTGNLNINTKRYWNSIYGDEVARATYDAQGTDEGHLNTSHGVVSSVKTTRFTTALAEVKDGDTVLDMGCGVGTFTKLVKKTYPKCEVWGTDISDQAIEDNKKENPEIVYKHTYIGFQDKLPRNYFDVIFCGETIEHLDEPKEAFREALELLKPGGKFVITTPKEEHIRSEEHVWFYTQEDVENLYLSTGFDRVEFRYLDDLEHMLIIFGVGYKA